MSNGNSKRTNAKGLVAAAVIFVVALAAWGITQVLSSTNTQDHLFALVHDSNGNVTALELDHDAEKAITTDLGTNMVTVKNGSVSVSSADCDNQDCVHQGSISSSDRQIICLPHKLWIEIVSADSAEAATQSGSSQDESKTETFDTTSR